MTRIAVILPCYNEEAAIGATVAAFARALPGATVFVVDNGSTDATVAVAEAAGAAVRHEKLRGKGQVVRRAFADIEADVYVLADGDATYDAASAPAMVRLLHDKKLDMVVGARVGPKHAYRAGHVLGNRALSWLLRTLFGRSFTDVLSGYRVFSRRFVKSFPALAAGFEIETEMSVHALSLRLPSAELPTPYAERPAGSSSKLGTWRDGRRIAWTMAMLFRIERPLWFFGLAGLALAVLSLVLAAPLAMTFARTGLVPRLPTAVLCTGLMLLAFLSTACGLILDTVTRGRREMRRLAYLALPGPD